MGLSPKNMPADTDGQAHIFFSGTEPPQIMAVSTTGCIAVQSPDNSVRVFYWYYRSKGKAPITFPPTPWLIVWSCRAPWNTEPCGHITRLNVNGCGLTAIDARELKHLCPACPIGTVFGKNNGENVNYCCPPRTRKTITKTVKRNVTQTKIHTATVSAIRGFLFNDVNGNGVKDPGDKPVVNQPLVLVGLGRTAKALVKRQGCDILASARTDINGQFYFVVSAGTLKAGYDYGIAGAGNCAHPLAIFQGPFPIGGVVSWL